MKIQVRLGFESIFPDEYPQEVNVYLSGIGKNTLKKIPILLHAFHDNISSWDDWGILIFNKWFSEKNKDFANYVHKKVIDAERKMQRKVNKASYSFLDKITSLIFLEHTLKIKIDQEEDTIDSTLLEQNIFKAILALNSKQNSKDDIATDEKKFEGIVSLPLGMTITYGLGQYEIVNTSITQLLYVLTSQLIKAIYCFNFLEETLPALLSAFYTKYECADFKEYIRRFTSLAEQAVNKSIENRFEPRLIEVSPQDSKSINFLENFVILPDSYNDESDFKLLRSAPLIKYSEYVYTMVDELFVIQKLYNGLYFELRDIYKDKRIGNAQFRQYYTTNFTEKFLLYRVLDNINKKRNYVQLTGDQISRLKEGGCDYYIRNGNKIFLFENKDILINADIKVSYDFEKIIKTIDDKLVRKEGIPQIINNIRFVLNKEFKFDTNYKVSTCKIYPIIVIHNKELDIPGINTYLNEKFKVALQILINEGLDTSRVQDLTLIHIDSLLIYQRAFIIKKFTFDEAICDYHKYVKNTELKAKSQIDLERRVHQSFSSFSDFFWNFYCNEKGVSLEAELMNWLDNYFEPTLFNRSLNNSQYSY